MQFGMPSLLELGDLKSQLSLCKQLDLDIIELNMNLPQFTTSQLIMDEFIDFVYDMEKMLGIHLPETIDIAEFNPEIRQSALQLIRTVATHYDHDKVRHMTMHLNPGTYFKMPEGKVYLYDKHKDQYLKHFKNAMTALQDVFEYSEIQLLIENTGNFHMPFIQEALEIALAYPFVGLVWDVGHEAKSIDDKTFIDRYADRIQLIHLHDCAEGVDHLPLYCGELPISEILHFAKKRKIPVVVEVKTKDGLESSIDSLRKKGHL